MHDPTIGLTEAAKVLEELSICKAYGDAPVILDPNCQSFGFRKEDNKWQWNVRELLAKAREQRTATPDAVRRIEERYGLYQATEQGKLTINVKSELLFVNTIRNCLVHNVGVQVPASQVRRATQSLNERMKSM